MSPTGRSCNARNARMSRRRGSATALNVSEVVEARGMRPIYSYMGICQPDFAIPWFRTSCYASRCDYAFEPVNLRFLVGTPAAYINLKIFYKSNLRVSRNFM